MRIFLPLLALLVIPACSNPAPVAKSDGDQLTVTATTGMITDAVRIVGGDRVTVSGLMGPGVDPHLYKATQGDLAKLSGADIVFYNGLHLEGRMVDVFENLAKRIPTIAVGENIPTDKLRTPPEFNGHYDPHVWFDVSLWKYAVEAIRDALIKTDPAHESEYQQNADTYLAELTELDTYARDRFASVPADQRILITAHDAFGYMGIAYDVEVHGLQGISTAAEYGLQDVTSMVDLIVEKKIRAVFVESSVSPRSIEALVQGTKSKGHEILIGGQLFSDALGAEDTPEGHYIGMVRHNVDTIVEALQ